MSGSGWSNQVVSQVVIAGPSGQLLVYSPTVGAGHLIASISGQAGTDPYGNAYHAGLAVGNQAGAYSSIDPFGNVFVQNSAGKIVDQIASGDGSVRVYNSSGAGLGNLIASVAPAGSSDSFGNVYDAGVTAYVVDVNSLRMAVNLNVSSVGGNAGLSVQDIAHPPHSAPGAYGQGSGSGGLSRAVAFIDSGLVTVSDVDAVVSAQSQTHSAVTNGLVQALAGEVDLGATPTLIVNDNNGTATLHQALLSVPAAPGNGFSLYADASSAPAAITTSGIHGGLPMVQTDTGANTNANAGGATRISAIWTVPANDMQAGTVYELEVPYVATLEGNTFQLGLSVDGSGSFNASATLAAAIVGAGTQVQGFVRTVITVLTTGVSGTIQVFLDGAVQTAGVQTTYGNSAALTGRQLSTVIDTTASHTFRINSLWGASNASQTVTGYGSVFTRKGP